MGKLSLKGLSWAWLCIYIAKFLITGVSSLNEVLLVAILSGLTAFYEVKAESKEIKKIREELNQIRTENKEQDMIINDLRSSVASVKITSGFKNISGGGKQ